MTVRNLFLIGLFGICSSSEESKNQQLLDRIEALERTQTELMHVVERLSKSDSCAKALSAKCNGIDLTHLNKRLEVNPTTPVAFSAYINHSVDKLVHGAVIPFERVTMNEGNAFNGGTGIFTCPKSGLYLFMWNVMVDQGHQTQISFVVNGATRRWSYAVATAINAGYQNAANHDIVRLNEGDKVWVADDYASGEIHPHHTTFSGVLLSQ
ncbi:complement C1q-like protein 4 [Mytilus galloprovincialis]|uniref:complement C1q-like protein 4 n=1 Tax=Mytilus galloprovincialis TaxID=29158 RepID=UPI003F7B5E32